MKVLQRYFATEILQAVFFVLVAFLALFTFFDLTNEMQSVGRGGYGLQHASLYVLMGLPSYVHQLMPIAALIGTIYTLAQFAARSEFTIMRASSMSTLRAGWMLAKIGLLLAVLTFVFGEFVAPFSTRAAEKLKLRTLGSAISQQFRSGLWTKDVIKDHGLTGTVIGSRFLNVRESRPDGQLLGLKSYEFDLEFRLLRLVSAEHADYQGGNTWHLAGVTETRFLNATIHKGIGLAESFQKAMLEDGALVTTEKMASKELVSEITPQIISVLFADPDRMSAYDLALYQKHLAENKQDTQRYQIAFWTKITYPFAVFVMMALALPFAYLHVRKGGVSLKIFVGIMIGVSFHLLNNLFSTLGLLNTWPPITTALAPSLLFSLVALLSLWWVERH
jgi:lipopolysaccharide export system permease protein